MRRSLWWYAKAIDGRIHALYRMLYKCICSLWVCFQLGLQIVSNFNIVQIERELGLNWTAVQTNCTRT